MSHLEPGSPRRGPKAKLLRFARARSDEAVDLEIRHHLDAKIERLVADGMEPDAARREAERAFGDVDRVRDEMRRIDRRRSPVSTLAVLVDGFASDFHWAIRSAVRTPWFALAVVGVLGLGIGVNVAIYSVVRAVLLRPLPGEEPDRIVAIQELTPQGRPFTVAPANYIDWSERQDVFEAMAVAGVANAVVVGDGDPSRVAGARVSADYFRVLGVQPVMGRTFTPEEDRPGGPPVVVVSHAFWVEHLGGDPGAVGHTVRLDGRPFEVIGVMPEALRAYARWYLSWDEPIEVWYAYAFASNPASERRSKRLTVTARLRDGVTVSQADSRMKALARALADEYPDTNEGWSAEVEPLHALVAATARGPLLVLFGAVGFILLICCLNVGNLLLARADVRRSEVTVRRALGAGRGRILRQLLAESLVLSLTGAALGILLARALLPVLVEASPINFRRLGEVTVDGSVLAFALGVTLLVAVLTGLAPAIRASASDLLEALNEQGYGRTESRRTRVGRSAIVVSEVALTVALVIGAGLMAGSYLHIAGLDTGLEAENVTAVRMTLPRGEYADPVGRGTNPGTANFTVWRPRPTELRFVEQVLAAMRRVPGVEAVAAANLQPMAGMSWAFPAWPAEAERTDDPRYLGFRAVTADWFGALGIPIVRGRSFPDQDVSEGDAVVVLDQSAAATYWPGQDPIGRSIMLQDGVEDAPRPFRVIGIARDERQAFFDNSGTVADGHLNVAWVPLRSQARQYVDWQIGFRMSRVFLVRTRRRLGEIAPELRKAVWSVDAAMPADVGPLSDLIAGPLESRRFYAAMLILFGALAGLLAAAGVFAVTAYSVSRKNRELGIRLALGARPGELQRVELVRALKLAAIGSVIGAIAAVWLTRFIASFLYGVQRLDPATYVAAGAVLTAVTLSAAWLPAHRASSVDPVQSLRAE